MAKVLIPGSFDPLHNGHVDVVDQALELFDEVVFGVLVNFSKPSGLFSPDERVGFAVDTFADRREITVGAFEGLVVDVAAAVGADFIVKGLRTGADFEIEQQMAQTNHKVSGIRTVYVPSRPDLAFVSSRFVREIAQYRGDVSGLVPPAVAAALEARFGAGDAEKSGESA
jgi:pantetheine-phosphate adenylyltransferase